MHWSYENYTTFSWETSINKNWLDNLDELSPNHPKVEQGAMQHSLEAYLYMKLTQGQLVI